MMPRARCGRRFTGPIVLAVLLLASWGVLAASGSHGESAHGAAGHESEHGGEEHGGGELFRVVNATILFGGLGLMLWKRARRWMRDRGAAIVQAIRSARQEARQQKLRLEEEQARAEGVPGEVEAAEQAAETPLLKQAREIGEEGSKEIERLRTRIRMRTQQAFEERRHEVLEEAAEQVATQARQRIRNLLTPEAHRRLVEAFLTQLESEET